MPEERVGRAVNYYYLLKEDESDRQRLWSLLAGDASKPVEAPLSLDLTGGGLEPASQCRLVHHAAGAGEDHCLLLLPDLAVVESIYKTAGAPLEEQWREALARLEADRERAGAENINVFGETTVLLAEAASAENLGESLSGLSLPSGRWLESTLSAETGSPGKLYHLVDGAGTGRDFFAMATDGNQELLSSGFPLVDGLIKKLRRVAALFREQRRAIDQQRGEIDGQVGTLLHEQVVADRSATTSAAGLDQRIGSLSRMFGLLSTDSLLVRQAGDRLEGDTAQLAALFKDTFDPTAAPDLIGEYYLKEFETDLADMRGEARHLDFSRTNTQAAIEVVRTQVELLRAGEEARIQEQTRELLSRSLILQKERMSLQVAAGFVEFVLVFYYVLKSWEGVVGVEAVEHLSPWLRALLVGGFSAGAAFGTHFLAQALHTKSVKNTGLWISFAVLVLSFVAMVMLTVVQH